MGQSPPKKKDENKESNLYHGMSEINKKMQKIIQKSRIQNKEEKPEVKKNESESSENKILNDYERDYIEFNAMNNTISIDENKPFDFTLTDKKSPKTLESKDYGVSSQGNSPRENDVKITSVDLEINNKANIRIDIAKKHNINSKTIE